MRFGPTASIGSVYATKRRVRGRRASATGRNAGGVRGHRRTGLDSHAQRTVRRGEEPRAAVGYRRSGSVGGDGNRHVPRGRQRRLVPRCRRVKPHHHQRGAGPARGRARDRDGAGSQGSRRPHDPRRRRLRNDPRRRDPDQDHPAQRRQSRRCRSRRPGRQAAPSRREDHDLVRDWCEQRAAGTHRVSGALAGADRRDHQGERVSRLGQPVRRWPERAHRQPGRCGRAPRPHILGGSVAGTARVDDAAWAFDGADVYAEKNCAPVSPNAGGGDRRKASTDQTCASRSAAASSRPADSRRPSAALSSGLVRTSSASHRRCRSCAAKPTDNTGTYALEVTGIASTSSETRQASLTYFPSRSQPSAATSEPTSSTWPRTSRSKSPAV